MDVDCHNKGSSDYIVEEIIFALLLNGFLYKSATSSSWSFFSQHLKVHALREWAFLKEEGSLCGSEDKAHSESVLNGLKIGNEGGSAGGGKLFQAVDMLV